uniref:Phospholipid-transporting ATPase n=1 Tax=Panagrellus redivivus TaxID=6233 RepID=A0A7E4UWR8_PANRE
MPGKEQYHLLDMDGDPRESWFKRYILRRNPTFSRTITVGEPFINETSPNYFRNQKYSILTFVPLVLFEQFKFFLNLFFLIIAVSQFCPALRIGDLFTYWGPLGFVLSITLIREAYEDFRRYLRDRIINNQKYKALSADGSYVVKSKNIRVGDVLLLQKDQRIPADVILLQTSDASGTCFVRTDQLDGETDWKLKHTITDVQRLPNDKSLFAAKCKVFVEKPHKDIYSFIGTLSITIDGKLREHPLSVENALWATTTLTAGSAVVLVVYTGKDTRSEQNSSTPHCKVGLLDLEINTLTKYLFIMLTCITLGSMGLKSFSGDWVRDVMRFALLYSYIIPISLRVNMEMAKLYYSYSIGHDANMPGTNVRNSSIPEELGRISYLLTDKTGTLTKNEMTFRKLHVGSTCLNQDAFQGLKTLVNDSSSASFVRGKNLQNRICQALEAITLCHNVTPTVEQGNRSYQAASPDEVALVEWAESVGVTLIDRNTTTMTIQFGSQNRRYRILDLFPFTAERKRMGIIVQNIATDEISFICKGADSVMAEMVQYNDWLEESSANMAREGLRTLVVAQKLLTKEEYSIFEQIHNKARLSTNNRLSLVDEAIASLEHNLKLLCVTGVEDQLQDEVRTSIESLIQGGINICMLTGDKLETAVCIAKSCGLFKKHSYVMVMDNVASKKEVNAEVSALSEKVKLNNCVMVATGNAMEQCLKYEEEQMASIFMKCQTVVCCRCSPEQKASIVELIQKYKPVARVAAIGDGGNDVAMIQAAHVGIGIEAKEGKQASLAADFSISEFRYLLPLLMIHGRYSYKQSCALAQFVMYRGIILTILQVLYCNLLYFVTLPVFDNFLMMAYTSIYTPLAVFALVLDRDVTPHSALIYSDLYKELIKGRYLTLKTFLIWSLISVYQAGALFYGALYLCNFVASHFATTAFSGLILTELAMVMLLFHRSHILLYIAELQCVLSLVASLFALPHIFDRDYAMTWQFWVYSLAITAACVLPFVAIRFLRNRYAPPSTFKVK